MSKKERPKKPARNPGHIVFPKQGPVRQVVEELPREQESLELRLGRKFLGALNHFEGIEFHELSRGVEPADLMCKSSDREAIGIQIVEVINHQLRQLQEMRSSYRDALMQTLGDELLLFNGCKVSLVDVGDPPYLPKVSSKVGQVCLRVLADHLRSVAKEIHTLGVGKIRNRSVTTSNPEHKVGALIERIMLPGEPVRLEFTWTGGGPSYRTDVPRGFLPSAVQSKIAKRYAKPKVGKFLLLAYSIDTMFAEDDPDLVEARRILETSQHPFDDTWYLYPYADKELGHLIHIWPT